MIALTSYIRFVFDHKKPSSKLLIEDLVASTLDGLEYIGRSEDKINLRNDSKMLHQDFRKSKDIAILEFNL